MNTLPFSYVIGLEIHVELSTNTKMFCRCKNEPFFAEPNENTCPICMALPGTLPVPNKEAIRKILLVGKALGSTAPEIATFDRKHYFYPDSPKGYQISQAESPFCQGGFLELLDGKGNLDSRISFDRVHLEEDAGKLLHGAAKGYTQVDLNRAGVPLMEMVTEPVLTSPAQARKCMQEIQLLVRTLGVSEADMEKGHMRCDANISLKFEHEGQQVWTPITEIKNVNSTRGVERGLTVEGQRLYDEWISGGDVRTRTNKITVGWDANTNSVQIHRAKEAAKDYRYMPEPDIPGIKVRDSAELNPENMQLSVLPNELRKKYFSFGLAEADIELLLSDQEKQKYFDSAVESSLEPITVTNWLVNAPQVTGLAIERFTILLRLVQEQKIAFTPAKQNLDTFILQVDKSIEEIAQELGILQENDPELIAKIVDTVLKNNPGPVEQYKNGELKTLGFLVGQAMKEAKGAVPAALVKEQLLAALDQ